MHQDANRSLTTALRIREERKNSGGNDHLDPLMELYRRLPGKTCSSVSTIDPFEAAEAAAVVMWSIQLLLALVAKRLLLAAWLFILDKIESLKVQEGVLQRKPLSSPLSFIFDPLFSPGCIQKPLMQTLATSKKRNPK